MNDKHPDEVIAREEITRYFDDEVEDAYTKLAAAEQECERRRQARSAWLERGEILVDGPPEHHALNQTGLIGCITGRSTARYMRAAKAAIDNRMDGGLHNAAVEAGERDEALRRWLTAQGYDLGATALPAPTRRGGRR